jgi:predicted N-acyltransferase
MRSEQSIFSQHGFTYEDHLNYLIDLDRSPEAIFQSVAGRTRKYLKRGLNRQSVVIKEVRDKSQLPLCYDLLKRTYRAARVPLADPSLFEAAFDVLYPLGMVRFSLATVKGHPAAVSIDLLYKDIVYGWYGGMDREFGAYRPGELVTWDVLKWAAESGFKVFDFGGAGKPDEGYGVRDFKAKFGGRLVCYGRNTFVHAPHLLSLSRMGYGLIRSLLGMVPSRLSGEKHVPLQ